MFWRRKNHTNSSGSVGINDFNDDTICGADEEEETQQNHPPVQHVYDLLHEGTFPVVAVAVQPQKSGKAHGQRSKANRANKGNQIVENRNGLSEDEGNGSEDNRAAHPGSPVNHRVALQVTSVTQDTHKDVLGRNLEQNRVSMSKLILNVKISHAGRSWR